MIHACFGDSTGDQGVCRVSLNDFLADAEDVAIFRSKFDAVSRARIAQQAASYLGLGFDTKFDLETRDRVYCSELVRLSVNSALESEIIPTSMVRGKKAVALDDCYLNPFFSMVCEKVSLQTMI